MKRIVVSGIYMIKNSFNGKIYIGKAKNIYFNRFPIHIKTLRRGKHFNVHLQRAWDKYGEENFEFSVLKTYDIWSEAESDEDEKYFIKIYDSSNPLFGYNKTLGGGGVISNEETRLKQSNSAKKKWESEEKRLAMSILMSGENNPMFGMSGENNPNFGKTPSEETRKKMRESSKSKTGENNPMFGRKQSAETRKKISENRKYARGSEHPMFGKKHTEEAKRKISESKIGKKRSSK